MKFLKKIGRKAKRFFVRASFLLARLSLALQQITRGFLFLLNIRENRSGEITEVAYRVYGNGLKSSVRLWKAKLWSSLVPNRITIVLFGTIENTSTELTQWIQRIHRYSGATFMVESDLLSRLSEQSLTKKYIRVSEEDFDDFSCIRKEILKDGKSEDVLFLDAEQPLLSPLKLQLLKYALSRFQRARRLSAVFPLLSSPEGVLAGWDFDRQSGSWAANDSSVNTLNQLAIPRYVLAAPLHGALLAREFIEATPASRDDTRHEQNLNSSFISWLQNGLTSQSRALVFPMVVAELIQTPEVTFSSSFTKRLAERPVNNADGMVRIIFVLPATTISGGIRAVFEMATALSKRDFNVEIWSIQGQPTWTDVPLPIQHFQSYEALLAALSGEKAIKVATWWETAQIVWLSSVEHGVPTQFVQEFETWFYPADITARSAVAACYRREFEYLTTGSFTQNELTQVSISAEIIPVAYDSTIFYQRKSVIRDERTMLAVGRSFFQKNFVFTAAAWKSLKSERPPLTLFGQEPHILPDSRVTYHVKPTDDEVAELYSGAGVFVQTSLHEGFCLPVLEAMACGCPVITTNSHGNMDFCEDGENCIIVEQNDVPALANTIRRVLNDETLRERLRQGGLRTAERYQWNAIVPRLEKYFASVADRAKPVGSV